MRTKHAVLYKVTSAEHGWVSLEKIWIGKIGRLEEKNAVALFLYDDCIHFLWLV
jgi:hypothetical protein